MQEGVRIRKRLSTTTKFGNKELKLACENKGLIMVVHWVTIQVGFSQRSPTHNLHSEVILAGKHKDSGRRWKRPVQEAKSGNVVPRWVLVGTGKDSMDHSEG